MRCDKYIGDTKKCTGTIKVCVDIPQRALITYDYYQTVNDDVRIEVGEPELRYYCDKCEKEYGECSLPQNLTQLLQKLLDKDLLF